MGGLGVLFCIGLYLFIAFKVIGAFKTSRYQWLVIALVVLIPSGDAVVGRWYLQHLCAKEGSKGVGSKGVSFAFNFPKSCHVAHALS